VTHSLQRALANEPGPLVGLTCLAGGSDQIFAQIVIDHGGSIESFIPAKRFPDTLSGESRAAYETLRDRSKVVHELPYVDPGPASYMEASRKMVDDADVLFAVWDGEPARGYGGTADVAAYARERGVPVEIIWPDGVRRS
jgi:hypothetical protein